MTASLRHRLEGLEPDNLLAFLSLLGVLRALEVGEGERPGDERLSPRACWDLDTAPLRPLIVLRVAATQDSLLEAIRHGLEMLATAHDFEGRKDLNYTRLESRSALEEVVRSSHGANRHRADLLAALMSDGAIKEKDKTEAIDPTPLCLLFGQGHQHFLDRLATVPRQPAPPAKRGTPGLSASECLREALFEPWHRHDETFSFRWDPAEDVRYALMAGDPTDGAYKTGTQHGANRLAAVGLCALSLVPEVRAGRVRPAILGGRASRDGFSFSWPVWRDPASLAAVRALLAHPDLRSPAKLAHLSVDHVVTAHRISVGKFMNFTRAREESTAF